MRLHLLWQHFGLVKGYGGASAAQKRKRKITIIQCVFLDVCSVLFLFCFISVYAYIFKHKFHCGSAIQFSQESADHLITANQLYAFLL